MRISSYPWVGGSVSSASLTAKPGSHPPCPSRAQEASRLGLLQQPSSWPPASSGQPCWAPEYNPKGRLGPYHCSLFKTHSTKRAYQSRGLSCSQGPTPLQRRFPLRKMPEMAFFSLSAMQTLTHAWDSKATSSMRPSQFNLPSSGKRSPFPGFPWPLSHLSRYYTLLVCGHLRT